MLRKIDRQRANDQAIYECPETGHWADWRDADAIAYHGTLIARRHAGHWQDANGERVPESKARSYGAMRSVGISTR